MFISFIRLSNSIRKIDNTIISDTIEHETEVHLSEFWIGYRVISFYVRINSKA